MVIGPVYGYYAQYAKVKEDKSVGNFSIDVCAILIYANVLRIFFWFGERYETPLLLQSIMMIATQIVLLAECLKQESLKKGKQANEQKDGEPTSIDFWMKFWRWNDQKSYISSVVTFTCGCALITLMFFWSNTVTQMIGLFSAMIEATLGFPQLIKNYKSQNASGISYGLIGSWFLGDAGKTAYFIYKHAPFQFLMCGIIQLTVDILIILQMKYYKSEEPTNQAKLEKNK